MPDRAARLAPARGGLLRVGALRPGPRRLPPPPRAQHADAGIGASLGALALLHARRLHPGAFGALLLQSGSFFRQRWDRQESGFPRFRRISRFVGGVLHSGPTPTPIPITLTCGAPEENLANNRAVATALRRQGHPAALHVTRDAHNFVAWRDALDPYLVDLLARAWGITAAPWRART